MKKLYWYKTCPFCNEGRLFIFKKLQTGSLYFHCEECERGFNSIRDIEENNSFLTLSEEFDSEPATESDIKKSRLGSLDLMAVTE